MNHAPQGPAPGEDSGRWPLALSCEMVRCVLAIIDHLPVSLDRTRMSTPEELVRRSETGAGPSSPSADSMSGPDDVCDVHLMGRAMDGDGEALEALLEAYWAPLAAYAGRLLGGSPEMGEDVAQEVFLRIWQRRVNWKPGGSVRAYLYGLARNLVANQRRSIQVRIRAADRVRALLEERHRSPTPLELVEWAEERAAIERAIAALPPRRREIFVLVRVHGTSYREAAEILGLSPQTIANQMSMALAELRRLL